MGEDQALRLDWLRKHFRPQAAAGFEASYQVRLRGKGGGDLWLRVAHGELECGAGRLADPGPDVDFALDAADYEAILAGRENPELLAMSGRLEVRGDSRLAIRLRSLFGPVPNGARPA